MTESKTHFKKGVKSVFPGLQSPIPERQAEVEVALDILYDNARCGLYHMAQTRKGIVVQHSDEAMCFIHANKTLYIDPHKLPQALTPHLDEYKMRLLCENNVDDRTKFERAYDHYNSL